MNDASSHRHVHRIGTLSTYYTIHSYAESYLRANPGANLVQFCEEYDFSRRQVQRALAYFETSWRLLKKSDG